MHGKSFDMVRSHAIPTNSNYLLSITYSWALSACSQLLVRYYCFCFSFRSQNDFFSREIKFLKKAIGYWESRMERGLKHLSVWTMKSVEFGLWPNSWHPWFHITTENLSRHRILQTGNASAETSTKTLQMPIGKNISKSPNWRFPLIIEDIYCQLQFQTWDKWKPRVCRTLLWPWLVPSEVTCPWHWESWCRSTEIQGDLSILLIRLCGSLRGLCYRQVSTWHEC